MIFKVEVICGNMWINNLGKLLVHSVLTSHSYKWKAHLCIIFLSSLKRTMNTIPKSWAEVSNVWPIIWYVWKKLLYTCLRSVILLHCKNWPVFSKLADLWWVVLGTAYSFSGFSFVLQVAKASKVRKPLRSWE